MKGSSDKDSDEKRDSLVWDTWDLQETEKELL